MPLPFPNRVLWSTDGNGLQNPVAKQNPSLTVSGNSGPLDVAGYKELIVVAVLASFTGGTTPSFQPEWDLLTDFSTPDVIPLWKPTAATAATNWLALLGVNSAAAPTIAGWVVASYGDSFGGVGQVAWTVVGAPTAVTGHIYVYGK